MGCKKGLMQTLYPFIYLTAMPKGTTREQSPFVLGTIQTRECERLTLPKITDGTEKERHQKGQLLEMWACEMQRRC